MLEQCDPGMAKSWGGTTTGTKICSKFSYRTTQILFQWHLCKKKTQIVYFAQSLLFE